MAVNIIQDILNYFRKLRVKLGLGGGTDDSNQGQTSQGGPSGGRTVGGKKQPPPSSVNFGKFLLVPMPDPKSDSPTFADEEEAEKYANEVGEQIRQAFIRHDIKRFDNVEIYPTATNNVTLRKYFSGDLDNFVGACEDKLFGGKAEFGDGEGEGEEDARGGDLQRVYLIGRNLKFDPAYDALVRNQLVVRPLERGRIYAPVDYTEMRAGTDQLILGQMEILRQGQRLKSAEVCSWVRSEGEQDATVIDVDFDLLARAESLKDMNAYPLGLTFYCNFRSTNVKREIEEVLLDIGGAKSWMERVPGVRYYIDTGGGRSYKRTPVTDYPDNIVPVTKELKPKLFKLGENQAVTINRWIDIIADAEGRERRYSFGFFDRAIKFSADQNVFRVTGQLLPASRPVEVMLPASPNEKPQSVFSLTPRGDGKAGYRLTLLKTRPPMTATINGQNTLARPGDSADISPDDEIVVTSTLRIGGGNELHKYTLQPLNDLQQAYTQKVGRDYAFRMSINSTRDVVLSGKRYKFGRGRAFPATSTEMEMVALIFEREWVSVRMRAGDDQAVYYRNTVRATPPGGEALTRLDTEGINLDLNGSYAVYFGDYEVTLTLNATPAAAELMIK